MYLSRVEIDTNNRRKIRDLTHLGAFHSWVEDSFPEERNTLSRTRKLWRIDRLNGHDYMLVISHERPDLNCLEKYGVAGSAQTKSYDHFLQTIEKGGHYLFKVTLNPVHSVSEDKGVRGKVYPEITVEQQMSFLQNRAEKHGFHLPENEFRITERRYDVLKKSHQRPVRISRVSYEGRLIVMDADLFRSVLMNGMGREKAYGCGMMTVIPEKS